MEKIKLPKINLEASRIGLGTWAIGGSLWGGTSEQESIETIIQALNQGINFIDTAPAYGNGESETIVGKALKKYGKRDQVIVATKFGLNFRTEGQFYRDSRRDSIIRELDDSLKRLQVDQIDLYQAHWPDPTTPIEETAKTLKELQQQGKIKAIGVSNYSVEQMQEFKKYAELSSDQPPFNIFEREAEKEILPFCIKEGMGIIGYSGLCRGLLSGKMTKDHVFKGDDLRKGMDPKFKDPQFSQYLKCADQLKEWVQKKYNKPLIALAVRWVLDKKVSISLWGARNPGQLKDIDQVSGWKLTAEDFAAIDKIVQDTVKNPVGPQFMEPPIRKETVNV